MRFVKDHFDEYRESTIGGKYAFENIWLFMALLPLLLSCFFYPFALIIYHIYIKGRRINKTKVEKEG